MSESQADSDTASDSPGKPPATTTRAPRSGSRGAGWLAAFAVLLALTALALTAGLSWQEWQRGQAAEQRAQKIDTLQQRLQGLAGNLERTQSSLNSDLAQLRSENATLATRLENRSAELQALAARLDEMGRVDRRLWQLAEAEYLLQLAQQRLLTADDARMALRLLRQADSIVRERRDPDLYPVRAALAREVAALEAVPKVDVDGLYLRLEALTERARALPLAPQPEWEDESTPASAPDGSDQGVGQRLQRGLAAAWQKLSDYVRIRRREQPVEPLLEPAVEQALRLTLALLLEQAQSALLTGNQKLFEHSLERASDWLEQHYRVERQSADALAAALRDLAATPVAPSLPELGAARRALADYLNGRQASVGDESEVQP